MGKESQEVKKSISKSGKEEYIEAKKRLLHLFKTISTEYGLIFLFFLIVYGSMFVKHYASDTYSILVNNGFSGTSFAVYGRFGCEIVYGIMDILDVDYDKIFPLLILCIIGALAFFTSVVTRQLISVRENITKTEKILLGLGVTTLTCNPFVTEWLQYWEGGLQWSFCLLFSALAIYKIRNCLSWKNFIIVTFLEFCSLSFYQASIALFLISGLLIVYVSNNGTLTKKALESSFWIIVSGGCASVLNLLAMKLCQIFKIADVTSRTKSITLETIWSNALSIIKNLPNLLINLYYMYPKFLFLLVISILGILVVVNLISQKRNVINKFLYIVLLLFACLFSVFIPHLMTTDLWIVQRTIIAFWGVLGAVEVICAITVEKGKLLCVTIGGFACFICILFIQIASYELIVTNMADKEIANAIEAKICEYENDTGKEVTTIYVHYDESPVWKYSFVKHSIVGDMTRRALTVSWADVNSINYYSGKKYNRCSMDNDVYINYFGNQNWDYFDINAQTYFEGNALYLICY
jgi:hypothetical protein